MRRWLSASCRLRWRRFASTGTACAQPEIHPGPCGDRSAGRLFGPAGAPAGRAAAGGQGRSRAGPEGQARASSDAWKVGAALLSGGTGVRPCRPETPPGRRTHAGGKVRVGLAQSEQPVLPLDPRLVSQRCRPGEIEPDGLFPRRRHHDPRPAQWARMGRHGAQAL